METYIIPILATIITSVASFVGVTIKNAYTKHINTKTKKEIIEATVLYVEQVFRGLDGTKKFEKAKTKSLDWLNEKHIKISEAELEILIEATVNSLKK